MPRNQNIKLDPIFYPISHEYRYALALKSMIKMIEEDLHQAIANADPKDIRTYLHTIDDVFNQYLPNTLLGTTQAIKFINQLGAYHNRHFFHSVNKAIGVDLKTALNNVQFNLTMHQAIANNVQLIQSIPAKLRDQIQAKIIQSFSETGFDQGQLSRFLHANITKALKGRFAVAKTRAKLIARDQTNKTISAMTEVRHRQLGIEEYLWLGVDDERERPSHVANNNKHFSYNNPPETGHPGHDINCRCVSVAHIKSEQLHQLAFGEIAA